MSELSSMRSVLARAAAALAVVVGALVTSGCPGQGRAAAEGGFVGTVVRGGDGDAPITVRLTDTTIPDISEMRAVGTITPADRNGRPITVVLDLNYERVGEGGGTVPLVGLVPGRDQVPAGGALEARYAEIDEDRPNGEGLVFPGAISDREDAYTVAGTAMIAVRREGVTWRVQGTLDATFTAADGTQRRLVGAFASNLAVPAFDGGVDLDARVPPPPPGDASDASDAVAPLDMGAPPDAIAPGDVMSVPPDATSGLPTCGSSSATRTCGLQYEGRVRTCTAGTMVTVGCHAGCMPPLGQCAGDAVLQVCAASFTTAPCGTAAIASNDDAPASLGCASTVASLPSQSNCPAVRFVCPADGRYTVWFGAYSASRPATACVVGASP